MAELPQGWRSVTGVEQEQLQRRYALEIARAEGRTARRVIAKDEGSDDLLVESPAGGFAIVHLTWNDDDRWPPDEVWFASFEDAVAALEAKVTGV